MKNLIKYYGVQLARIGSCKAMFKMMLEAKHLITELRNAIRNRKSNFLLRVLFLRAKSILSNVSVALKA